MKIIKLTLTLLFLLTLSACASSYRKLENLQVIQTIGIDSTTEGVSLSIASGQDADTSLMSTEGESISLAIESLQEYSSREEMFYAHTKYAVIGEDIAGESILPYIDFFERGVQLRFDIGMFIVKDGSAKELMTSSFSDTSDITDILTSLERSVSKNAHSYVFSSKDIARSTIENGAALICALEIAPTEDIIYSISSENVAIPAGFGVLKNGILCGYLDKETSAAALIVLGEDELGTIIIDSDRRYSLELYSNCCDISPSWSDGTLTALDIKCELSAGILEVNSITPKLTTEDFLALEDELSKTIADNISAAIDYTIIYKADFLALSNTLRRSSADDFEKIAQNFPENLSLCDINIEVTSVIDRSYDVRVPNS